MSVAEDAASLSSEDESEAASDLHSRCWTTSQVCAWHTCIAVSSTLCTHRGSALRIVCVRPRVPSHSSSDEFGVHAPGSPLKCSVEVRSAVERALRSEL